MANSLARLQRQARITSRTCGHGRSNAYTSERLAGETAMHISSALRMSFLYDVLLAFSLAARRGSRASLATHMQSRKDSSEKRAWCSGYHICFTRRRSWVRDPPLVFFCRSAPHFFFCSVGIILSARTL